MTVMTCPHCSATVEPAAFCTACGMALPGVSVPPRLVTGKLVAETAAGQKLQSDALLATATQAARSLLTVGIVNVAFSGLYAYQIVEMGHSMFPAHKRYLLISSGSMAATGAVFVAMYFWAKYAPLAAAIIALVVYLLRWAVDVGVMYYFNLHLRTSDTLATTSMVRLLMVWYLIRGVLAGARHRKLLRQQQQPSGFSVLPSRN